MKHKHFLLIILYLFAGLSSACAQMDSLLFHQDTHIDPYAKGELRFLLDDINFARDNEYKGRYVKGYTLPGFWLQPTLSFQPLHNLKLEAGVYLLRYWGANKYPNLNYTDIVEWKGNQTQRGFHCLPVFRVQFSLTRNFDILFGTLYGKNIHGLVEPLYNPEMGLTCDPEAGIQMRWHCRPVDLDAWINWESFIFRADTHQESFTFGLSTRLRANAPQARTHIYFPLQGLFQHRGGEINPNAESREVKTWLNAAGGIGIEIHPKNRILTQVNLETVATYFGQQKGSMFLFDKGYGIYAKAAAQVWRFRAQAGYAWCHNFITINGNPLFGATSIEQKGLIFHNPHMLTGRLEYAQPIGKGFACGIHADAYHHFSCQAYSAQEGWHTEPSGLSFAAGIYLRVYFNKLIKRF